MKVMSKVRSRKFECLSCGVAVWTKHSRCLFCNSIRKRLRENPEFLKEMYETHIEYANLEASK